MKNNASLARANKNIRRRKLCGKAVTVFLLVALSVVFLVPFAWMLLTSLKSMEEVYQRTIFPTKLHFDNYILAVTQIPFLRYGDAAEYFRHGLQALLDEKFTAGIRGRRPLGGSKRPSHCGHAAIPVGRNLLHPAACPAGRSAPRRRY